MAEVYNKFCDGVADIFVKKYRRVRKEGLDSASGARKKLNVLNKIKVQDLFWFIYSVIT